ncbi:MAG: hypothetical protein PH343_03520 [Nitrospira sp.]|nr:hypothetical protein [Nitrospira sp.]
MIIRLRFIILVLLLSLTSGCLGIIPSSFILQSKLLSAKDFLLHGNNESAIKLLKEIVNKKGVPDITDEAMFRLALAYISSSDENEKFVHSIEILKRLQREYPASIWAIQSKPLLDLITKARHESDTSQEINNLKRENKKLKQDLEQLKTLDIEIEKRPRR